MATEDQIIDEKLQYDTTSLEKISVSSSEKSVEYV